jgi:GNAT superfamily N-acetyltransferase
MVIREWRRSDLSALRTLIADALGAERGAAVLRLHLERHHVLVAEDGDDVVGVIAYRTDWFGCTLVSLVAVRPDARRRGVARALYRAVEQRSPSPRIFSSAAETDAAAIRMHSALGFTASGYIDHLPQGYRELLFYRRRPPAGARG